MTKRFDETFQRMHSKSPIEDLKEPRERSFGTIKDLQRQNQKLWLMTDAFRLLNESVQVDDVDRILLQHSMGAGSGRNDLLDCS